MVKYFMQQIMLTCKSTVTEEEKKITEVLHEKYYTIQFLLWSDMIYEN